MGRSCSQNECSIVFKILTGTHTGKRPLGRPGPGWQYNILIDLKEIGINTRTGLIRLRLGIFGECCECDIEPTGYIVSWLVGTQLINNYLIICVILTNGTILRKREIVRQSLESNLQFFYSLIENQIYKVGPIGQGFSFQSNVYGRTILQLKLLNKHSLTCLVL